MKSGYIYIIGNSTNSTIYIGVTNNLIRRVMEHRQKVNPESFTAKYNLYKLLYYEYFKSIKDAIRREKQLKKWRREKKDFLINKLNPEWKDLFETLL
jgi:putative endonuclease